MKKIKYILCVLLLLVFAPTLFVACDNKELAELKSKVETLEAENYTLQQEKSQLQTTFNALQELRIQQEIVLEELEDEIEELESLKESQEATISDYRNNIARLNEAQNDLISSNMKLNDEIEELEDVLADLQAELEDTNSDLADKIAELEELQTELTTTKTTLQELEAEIEALEAEIKTLETANGNLTTENENLTNENAELENENQELTTENENLTNANNNLQNENQDLKDENEELKETTSEMIVYQNKKFASVADENVEVTPVLENDKTYMFVNCEFSDGLTSTAEGIDARFYNCTFNSDGEKSLYLTSFINLEVVGCTFNSELGDLSWSTANYGIDLDIYNTTVQNITIAYNNFEQLTNASGAEKSSVAISIKVRLGENDNPTEEFWADKTEGKVLGTVIIEGNTFSETNNSLYLGTNPKGEDTEANLSSGAFNVEVRNNASSLNVYERYLYEKEATAEAQLVEEGTIANFGNKTELPETPTE